MLWRTTTTCHTTASQLSSNSSTAPKRVCESYEPWYTSLLIANSVFGMGRDLGTFLSVYGAAVDGNLLTWSIGGPDPRVQIPLNLLGEPQGISGSHNKYEADASPTRGDLYVYGNDYELVVSRFQRLYDLGKAKDDYNLQTLTDLRAIVFQESIDTNPYFFNGPFPGLLGK
jgi:hypothetical protein